MTARDRLYVSMIYSGMVAGGYLIGVYFALR